MRVLSSLDPPSFSPPCPVQLSHSVAHTVVPSSASLSPSLPTLVSLLPHFLTPYFILALGCSPPHAHFPSLVYTIAQKYTDTRLFPDGLRFNARIGMPISENMKFASKR